jgi:hypothetical protein
VNSELSLEDRITNLQRQLGEIGYHGPSRIDHDSLRLIALAGYEVWNTWFERRPPRTTLDFYGFDFNRHPIDFSGFIFRIPADGSACANFRQTRLDFANKFQSATFESQVLFKDASFGRDADFSHAVFAAKADFTGTKFGENANFAASKFHGDAIFTGCALSDTSDFSNAQFDTLASFQSKWLGHRITFEHAHFQGRAEFHATFGNLAIFRNARFRDFATFKSAKFGLSSSFEAAEFNGHADFESAKFSKSASFGKVKFSSYADFKRSDFEDGASFSSAIFESPALFDTASFGNDADFRAATFHGSAEFRGACFGDRPIFRNVRFVGDADFQAAAFGDDISFECAHFSRSADFSASIRPDAEKTRLEFNAITFAGASFLGDATFEGRKFKSTTRFGRPRDTQDACAAVFRGIPNFHGCELHQDTDFRDTMFRDDFDAIQGPDAARAYRTLKLAMEKAKATREEQQFFRLEMRAEHPGMRFWPRTISSIYAAVSDYGFSLRRPVIALLAASMLTGLIHCALANAEASRWQALLPSADFDPDRTLQWFRYVAINTLPVPGFDKTQMELREALFGKDGPVVSIAMGLEMIHKIISLGCVFLLGLALRNLFKMKS